MQSLATIGFIERCDKYGRAPCMLLLHSSPPRQDRVYNANDKDWLTYHLINEPTGTGIGLTRAATCSWRNQRSIEADDQS